MSAEPGSYKTYMLLETAIKVATGNHFLVSCYPKSRYVTTRRRKRLAVTSTEAKELKAPKDLPIYFYSYEGFTLDEEYVDRIILECKTHDIKLLW